jgi:hypothetical protein
VPSGSYVTDGPAKPLIEFIADHSDLVRMDSFARAAVRADELAARPPQRWAEICVWDRIVAALWGLSRAQSYRLGENEKVSSLGAPAHHVTNGHDICIFRWTEAALAGCSAVIEA